MKLKVNNSERVTLGDLNVGEVMLNGGDVLMVKVGVPDDDNAKIPVLMMVDGYMDFQVNSCPRNAEGVRVVITDVEYTLERTS